jgi:hypothetical protein
MSPEQATGDRTLDARRVTVRTRDFRGDVWLAHLAPAR